MLHLWSLSQHCYKYIQRYFDGKSEEQLPQKTVGRLLANSRPTVGRQSDNCWPIVGQLSADCRLPLLRKSSASSPPTVGRLSADCWPHVGNLLAKCRLRTLIEYQKSLSSQGRTLHIDAKWNFLTWVRHIVLFFLGTNLLAISPGERFKMMLQHIAELYPVH